MTPHAVRNRRTRHEGVVSGYEHSGHGTATRGVLGYYTCSSG